MPLGKGFELGTFDLEKERKKIMEKNKNKETPLHKEGKKKIEEFKKKSKGRMMTPKY